MLSELLAAAALLGSNVSGDAFIPSAQVSYGSGKNKATRGAGGKRSPLYMRKPLQQCKRISRGFPKPHQWLAFK